jgi:FkbM family methyltransferase
VQDLLTLPEDEFLQRAFARYCWREAETGELETFPNLGKPGAPRMWVIFQLYTEAMARGLAGQFPEAWVPKTLEEMQTVPERDLILTAFRSCLWRDPSGPETVNFSALWARSGFRGSVLRQIATSEEAKILPFPAQWQAKTIEELLSIGDEEFAEEAYRSLLWRPGDKSGLATWRNLLENGIPRIFVLYQIASSPEGTQFDAIFPEYWKPKTADELLGLPSEEFLPTCYRSALWREPGRDAHRYSRELNWGRSRHSVLLEIATSNEAQHIPHRIAGLESLPSRVPHPQLRWRLRHMVQTFLGKACNSVLDLDHRFDVLQDAVQQLATESPKSVAPLVAELERQHVVNRAFISQLKSAQESHTLDSNAIVALDQRLRIQYEATQASAFALQRQIGLLTNETQRERGFGKVVQREVTALRESSTQSAEYIIRGLDRQSNAIQEHGQSIGTVRTTTVALLDEIEQIYTQLNEQFATSTLTASSQLEHLGRVISDQNTSNICLLSKKADDYAVLLTQSLASLPRNIPVPLPDNLLLSKVGEHQFFIPAEDAQLVACLIGTGHLEPGLAQFLRNFVQKGMTVVDVGANIGLHSVACAQLVGPDGNVYCFEAAPRLARLLEMNLVMNQLKDRAEVRQIAVTAAAGTALFYLTEICGHSSLYNNAKAARPIEVQTQSLDYLLPQDARVDLVKIDVEGAEPLVLRGMSHLIARNPEISIVVEFAPSLLRRAECSPELFLEQLSTGGCELSRIDDVTGALTPVTRDTLLNIASSNLLVRKKSKGSITCPE